MKAPRTRPSRRYRAIEAASLNPFAALETPEKCKALSTRLLDWRLNGGEHRLDTRRLAPGSRFEHSLQRNLRHNDSPADPQYRQVALLAAS
jgi:hypothetical protein